MEGSRPTQASKDAERVRMGVTVSSLRYRLLRRKGMLAPVALLGYSSVRGPHFLKNQPAWTTWIVAAKQDLGSGLPCPPSGTGVGVSGKVRVAPSKAQEGGRAWPQGPRNSSVIPSFLNYFAEPGKLPPQGAGEELCGLGSAWVGSLPAQGSRLVLGCPEQPPRVLRFLWWKSPEKGEQRGGVGARLTLGRFPVPAVPRGFSSGLSSRRRTHEACLCPALSFLPLSSPSSPGAHPPAVGMVSHQREVSPTVGRTTGGGKGHSHTVRSSNGVSTQWWHHQVLAGFLEEVVSGKQTQQARAWFSKAVPGRRTTLCQALTVGLDKKPSLEPGRTKKSLLSLPHAEGGHLPRHQN